VSPRAGAWQWLPHARPKTVPAGQLRARAMPWPLCEHGREVASRPGAGEGRLGLRADEDSSMCGTTFWRHMPLSLYDRPGIGWFRPATSGGGAPMVLGIRLACVAEITAGGGWF
jgi:hypothetical protein